MFNKLRILQRFTNTFSIRFYCRASRAGSSLTLENFLHQQPLYKVKLSHFPIPFYSVQTGRTDNPKQRRKSPFEIVPSVVLETYAQALSGEPSDVESIEEDQ